MTAEAPSGAKCGSLTVVGTGIWLGQMTAETIGVLEDAEVVLAIVADPAAQAILLSMCRDIEDLTSAYREGRARSEIYAEMADRVMACVRAGRRVCLVTYGHPGVFCAPIRAALRTARTEGYAARMLPGISAEACLFADLGLDPGERGLQTYEATRFLRANKLWDPSTPLVLWQIGAVGDDAYWPEYPNCRLGDIVEKLASVYGRAHEVILYEAPTLPIQPPRIERVLLSGLARAQPTSATTLLVPPLIEELAE